ncbi:tRNA m(1)G methyltransferase, putative [Plasmodium ovale]|uniref:tRNA (guanine(9)-N(1))-methyltransferase n=2 Tax=Plasmodium ovale TaxID=36330 RepID=A0A1A8WFP7_PLAOA|nr:tRNA m(1)G methyltransferase, putative [Plasmodium ovale curtisi]SCP04518.1 tRNA m(1)G methyltransferase, putative [Plasmodium ovale]
MSGEDEIDAFFASVVNVIEEKDINKMVKEKKTKKEKKKEKREILREKRKKNRPKEKKKKKEKKKQLLLKLLSNLNEEEKVIFLKERKLLERIKKEKKKNFLLNAYNNGYKICFNCSFLNLMGEKEVSSLAKQIFLSYHYMIKSEVPIQFHFTHLKNNDNFFIQLQNKYSLNTWKVHIHSNDYWDVFPKEKIVVLSPDATEELTELRDDEIYVISALVDRSVSKNLSFYQASLHDLVTKKLPLEKYIKKKKSNVLNVNTVVEILLNYIQNKDWMKVFEKCIPQKKVLCFCHKSSCTENFTNINVNNEENSNEKRFADTNIL